MLKESANKISISFYNLIFTQSIRKVPLIKSFIVIFNKTIYKWWFLLFVNILWKKKTLTRGCQCLKEGVMK